jgi:hypothetical protein
VTITPDPAYTNDTLTAVPSGWNDPDGDPETYEYQWQKYDGATWQDGSWAELEDCTVDPDANTITATVNHFSIYTAMAHMAPAKFEVTGITITPTEAKPDESITVSVTVTNTGDLSGSYTVVLKIGGIAAQDKAVTLNGGESRTVSFMVTEGTSGTYTVNVSSASGSFTVEEVPPEGEVAEVSEVEIPEPTPTPTPTPEFAEKPEPVKQPEKTPEPTPTAPIVEPVTTGGTAWWLIVIYVAAGVIIVGLGTYFFVRKRDTAG